MDDTRELLKRMRGKKFVAEAVNDEPKKEVTMRDMLKITRAINEEFEDPTTGGDDEVDVEAQSDKSTEEKKMTNYFASRNIRVSIVFNSLVVTKKKVYWSFVINSVMRIAFKYVPSDKVNSGIVFEYKNEEDAEKLSEIAEEVKKYFDVWVDYWEINLP